MKRYLALSLLTLSALGCDAMTAHTDVVARADQHEFTVDETVELLASSPQIPAQADVVRSVADLWIDYILLAEIALQDSTLSNVDLDPLLRPYVEQQTFTQLREQVITADTVISDDELRALFEEQAPGTRVRARHILFTFPENATDAQRDSVLAQAQQVRELAASGEDFAELARQHSEDPGTAQDGGDLGFFQRGSMVQPFEEAAFALDPGDVSGVVETPFGLHIIKVEERESQSFEEVGANFRSQVIDERRQASLNVYVEGLREAQSMEIQEGAEEVARDLADEPPAQLTGRAASRELVSWENGALTAEELLVLFQGMPPQQRAQYASFEDEQMAQLLRDVATNELVLADAEERGITVPQTERDSIRGQMQTQLTLMVQEAGLAGAPQEGETEAEAVERRVRSLLSGILAGQQNVVPLGALSTSLREERETRINQQAITAAVERLEEQRSGDQQAPTAGQPPQPAPGSTPRPAPQTPDTPR